MLCRSYLGWHDSAILGLCFSNVACFRLGWYYNAADKYDNSIIIFSLFKKLMAVIYILIGAIVFWAFILTCLAFAVAATWDGIRLVTKSNWFLYYVLRKAYPSKLLREVYLYSYGDLKEYSIKFRLRNIKKQKNANR